MLCLELIDTSYILNTVSQVSLIILKHVLCLFIFMLIRSMTTMVKFHIPVLLPLSSGITAGFEKFWFNFPLAAVLLEVLPKYDFWIYCFDRSLNFFPPTYIQFHCSSLRIWSIHAFISPKEQHFTRNIRRFWTIS